MITERIAHLPERTQFEISRMIQIIFEEFEDSQKQGRSEKKRNGRILKIILFGHFAIRDTRQRPPEAEPADFDLLIVVNSDMFAEGHESWGMIADRLRREILVARKLTTKVSLTIHSLMDVNDQLARGRPFFVDIIRQGIPLYETPGIALAEPRPLKPEDAAEEARRLFNYWYPSVERFQKLTRFAIRYGLPDEGAFLLHQTVERLYHCALNVLVLYSPKSHRLSLLRAHAERVAPELAGVWPSDTRFKKRCFAKLDRAYVEARYSPDYEITREELVWLAERVKLLQFMVAELCSGKLGIPDPSKAIRHDDIEPIIPLPHPEVGALWLAAIYRRLKGSSYMI